MIISKQDLTRRDVIEIMKGRLDRTHWKEDSIYLAEEDLGKTELLAYLTATLKDFNYYGPTEVTEEDWNIIKRNVNESNSEITKQLVHEIEEWAKECFNSHSIFTICGV